MDIPVDELAEMIDRISAIFVDGQRDPKALTTLCGIELFQMLKGDLVAHRPNPTGRSKRELREATIARHRKIRPDRHVDTMSFTKTLAEVAAILSKRGGVFDDPVTGRQLVITGPTYEARGRKGDRQTYYLVIEKCSEGVPPQRHAVVAMPRLGRPIIRLHISRQRDMVIESVPSYILISKEECVKLEALEFVQTTQSEAARLLADEVAVEWKGCHVELRDVNSYRATGLATLRLPNTMGVWGLPTFLGMYGFYLDVSSVTIEYTPEQPELVWEGMLDAVGRLDPQPVYSRDYMTDNPKVSGLGPGQVNYEIHLQKEKILVEFSCGYPNDLRDAMRNFPMGSFFSDKLGLAADY